MKGLLGKKLGMTRIFDQDGQMIPVTLIQAGPCPVVQLKTVETDGYQAVQLGFLERKDKHTNKPMAGHFKRAGVKPSRILKEFRQSAQQNINVGDLVKADIFYPGEKLDITGTTKGRGFAGVMKRHGFHGHKSSHGTHESFRGPGAIGQCAYPGKVWKGKKMPGRMGNDRYTARNLPVIRLEPEKNLIWIKGAVPGPNGGILEIRQTKKK
ncbi:MAG: 50S ribosomal protein L3 [candidate division Zixibacteria bacterium]|nr:50S ribosomal protein L3 [Candidatus Tariuqbacter arcticus]